MSFLRLTTLVTLADFSSNTVLLRQPIGSKDSIKEEKEGWRRFFLAARNFEFFSNTQDQNQKIKNLYRLMSFLRLTTFRADPSWPDGTFTQNGC
jgi:hypothetical protein